jgi:putative endonuclease
VDHQYCVYIVASRSGTLYIGITNNLFCRVRQHKLGEHVGFSSIYGCDRLVYFESFNDVHAAIGREKQLKGWRREKKIWLIERRNPRWADLAEHWGAQMAFAGQKVRGDKVRPKLPDGPVEEGRNTGSFDSSRHAPRLRSG